MLIHEIPRLFDNDTWLREYALKQRFLIITDINNTLHGLYSLDLDALPTRPVNFKELFFKWLLIVNRDRINEGLPILCSYALIKLCPIWQLFPMPFMHATLGTHGTTINRKPTGTIGTVGTIGTIANRRTIGGSINARQTRGIKGS